MPENETLVHDARTASRWRPLGQRIDGGLDPTDAFPAIQNEFYALFQNVWRQWKDHGVDPADLFDAVLNDPAKLRELIKQSHFDRNAQLLRDVAAEVQYADMDDLVRAFLEAAWDSARGQLQLDVYEGALSQEFTDQIQSMLDRIGMGLRNNLSRFPSRTRREPPPDLDTRLGENLL